MPKPQLTKDEITQLLDRAYNVIEQAAERQGVQIPEYSTWENYPASYYLGYLNNSWRGFIELADKIDPAYLNRGEQNQLRRIISNTVMQQTLKAAAAILSGDYETAKKIIEHNMPSVKIKNLQAAGIQRYSKKELVTIERNTKTQTVNISNTQIVDPTEPMPAFPSLIPINKDIAKALNVLQNFWHRASALPDLTPEDRFLLTETATTYLPDAWRMYANLGAMEPDIQRQGEEMILAQLKSLTNRIRTISNTIGNDALKNLRAHTVFITGKEQAQQTTTLNLR